MVNATLPAIGTVSIPLAVSMAGGHPSREVDFIAVHDRLAPILDDAVLLGDIPILGSPAWVDIANDDVRWRHSVVAAGYRWAAREWLEQDARIEASRELSVSRDWSAVSRSIRQRNDYLAANPWARRQPA
ncbi:DUF2742 domain-containing protein [Rhodococcus sp. KRD175]|uniref:DUF2742 domain-containing protein n=1 Tax=Rhodococcus sp. KRD175 TaxID=2729729 RepID=UPI0019D30736|nr:DUF2742 domain-containing protein [Rhodococcus sp. KRD175]